VLTIRFNPETQQRSLDALQWGLIPYWATDPKISYRTINARAETVDKAPSFRQAFRKRRCLIPADGFYEWRKTAKPKLPFAIAMKEGRPFTFARLWENWKDPESDEWLERMDSRRPPGLRNRAGSSGFGNRCRRSVNHAESASRASALRATSR
jgi:putative SOS response-associated peptidase YedK